MTVTVIDLDNFTLARGGHSGGPPPGDPECELCAAEYENAMRALLRGVNPNDIRPTDERPSDVSPILHRLLIRLNDRFPDGARQNLKQFLSRPDQPSPFAGTADDGLDGRRRQLAVDWSARTALPLWLDASGMADKAAELRALPQITNDVTYRQVLAYVRDVRDVAYEVRRQRYDEIRAAVRTAVEERLREQPVADAAAAADAAADDRYWTIRSRVYGEVYTATKARIDAQFAQTIGEVQDSAVDLLRRLVRPEAA